MSDLRHDRLARLELIATVLLAVTGLTIWWPGVERWRRSLVLRRGVGWKRFVWDLHGVIGFWSSAFILVFGLSGIYLCAPEQIQAFADWLEPLTDANSGGRFVDGQRCTGSRICTSAASKASASRARARGSATRRRRRSGRCSAWLRRPRS